jgi:diguanylate cyclase (GGDEF)-like protein
MLNVKETKTTDPTFLDPLTGLYNKEGFSEVGKGIVATACWENSPVTLFYIDVDDFDGFNRRFGSHPADQLLLQIAGCLKGKSRNTDLCARLNADEFVLLLPQTGPESALQILHRMRDALDAALHNSRWSATASIGAVTYLVCPSSIETMLETVGTMVRNLKTAGAGQTGHHVVTEPK